MRIHARALSGIITAVVLSVAPLSATVANDIQVVTNGNNEVTREAVKFLRQELRNDGVKLNLVWTTTPAGIAPDAHTVVVVINTNIAVGIDPTLEVALKTVSGKKNIILVSLYKNYEISVSQTPAEKAQTGVDTIAAASIWGGFFGGANIIDMHKGWVKIVAAFANAHQN